MNQPATHAACATQVADVDLRKSLELANTLLWWAKNANTPWVSPRPETEQPLEIWIEKTNVPCGAVMMQAATAIERLVRVVEQLSLAEEGAKEAFGVVVQDKMDMRQEFNRQRTCIEAQQRVIVSMREEIQALKSGDPDLGRRPQPISLEDLPSEDKGSSGDDYVQFLLASHLPADRAAGRLLRSLLKQSEERQDDGARLDWLNQNFFSDEKDDWEERMAPSSTKWKFFAPQGHQGGIRWVLDAAVNAEKNHRQDQD